MLRKNTFAFVYSLPSARTAWTVSTAKYYMNLRDTDIRWSVVHSVRLHDPPKSCSREALRLTNQRRWRFTLCQCQVEAAWCPYVFLSFSLSLNHQFLLVPSLRRVQDTPWKVCRSLLQSNWVLLGDIRRSDVRHVTHHIIWQHLRAVCARSGNQTW